MGVFLFIDEPALVCGWVNFPILWPHTPVQTKVECGTEVGEVLGVRLERNVQIIQNYVETVFPSLLDVFTQTAG